MRDFSRKQFEAKMREASWEPAGVFGYWYRNGRGVSEFNYSSLRDALRGFFAAGKRHDLDAIRRKIKQRRKAKIAVQP